MQIKYLITPLRRTPCRPWLLMLLTCIASVHSGYAQLTGVNILGDAGLQSGTQAPLSLTVFIPLYYYLANQVKNGQGETINSHLGMNMFLTGVGMGSVDTACWIALFTASASDLLFLQVKETLASVLEAYTGVSIFSNHGQRIINGHRLMQPYSDIFLGWTESHKGRQFYVRQMLDVKIKFDVETFEKERMSLYSKWCGWALALSHARYGDPAIISGYIGESDSFENSISAFSFAYAYQNEKDY